jgi:mannan endo-1,4-beta-mannosidase
MRSIMETSRILVPTGGGNEFSNSNIPENWACEGLDVVDVHSYSSVDVYQRDGPIALQHALQAKKLLLFEEFGASGDKKASAIQEYIDFFNSIKVPWMPWEISKPGKGAKDFEFWTDEATYGAVALEIAAAQNFGIV